MKLPQPGTIAVIVVGAFLAIWLSNNVSAIAKIVGPKQSA